MNKKYYVKVIRPVFVVILCLTMIPLPVRASELGIIEEETLETTIEEEQIETDDITETIETEAETGIETEETCSEDESSTMDETVLDDIEETEDREITVSVSDTVEDESEEYTGDTTEDIAEDITEEVLLDAGNYNTGDDYPYKGKTTGVDPWNFYKGQCTSFVAWCLNSRNGVKFTNQYKGVSRWGNAKDWGGVAKSLGISVNSTPAVGAVAWSNSGTYGHVAWVREVNGSKVIIEEYNYSKKCAYGTRTLDKGAFTGYIHIKDIGSSIPSSPTVSSWSVTSTDNNKVSISLKWNKVSGATSYRIDRRPKGGEYSTIKTGVTATSYTDSGLQDGKTYYYRVYAVNSSGTSKEKNTCGCIGKPTISSWTANGTTSVTINWDDKGADATYTIQRRQKIAGATSEYQTIKTGVTGTSFKDTGLAAGTIYYYKVKGVNNTGSSLKSDSCRVWTKSNAPAVRTLSATSVQVSWSAVQFAGTYTLKRCLASDTSKWTTVKTGITGTSFTDTGLSPNTAYRYQIWPVGPANIDYITVQSNTSDPVTTKKGYYLDLNGYLDMNTNAGTIKDYGTVDVYINGRCVADDVGDYYQVVDDGATYEFKDIKAAAGKYYYGVSRGALKGTISGSAQTTVLHFGTMCQGGTKVLPEGKYVILSALDRTKCLDVADGGKTNGTNLQLWTYTGETSQAFALKYHPEGYYSLTDVNSGLYVNVEGSGSVNRTNLHLWDAENEKDAQWVIRESGDGYYHLITYRSSMYMDVTGAVSADGTNIQIYKGNGNAAQKFAFVPYEYTVGYDANGGTGAPAEQTKVYEKSLTLSETKPTREGYTFLGWAVDETGSVSYQPGAAYTDNAAVTLYAVWEKEETFTEGAVKVGSFSASAGEEISLPVMISDNPGLVSAEFTVGYDSSVLEWTGIEKGDFSGTLDGRPGTSITWFAEDPKTNETKSGTIVVLQFKVKDGIADTKTEVTVTYAADNVYNADEENVALKVVPGTVTIASYLPGDINGDGTVNNKDVTRLMRYVKYADVEVVTAAIDVNGDGTVNNKDVTRLMRYVKYKDVEIH